MTMAALRRGIHVLCEKPFALNLTEAREMKAAADRKPVVAMIDFEFRFAAARAYATELLKDNYVGEVRMADFNIHFGWRSFPEDRPWSWWSERARGGGVLGAFGSPAVDALRTVVGNPRRVFCDLATFVKERDRKTVTSDDAFTLIIEFVTGSRAALQITQVAGIDDAQFGIYGNEPYDSNE
jgi:predicted dehydrogenase